MYYAYFALENKVYVSRGCPKIYETQLIQVPLDSTYSVRCCSMNEKTCASVKCPEKVSHSEALSICQARGERLCFQTELTNHCCGSGCEYDGEWIWVADRVSGIR